MTRGLPSDQREELLVGFPGGARAGVPAATRFRSTWLASSLRSLREHGFMDRYLANLPAQYHEPILTAVAGTWLPIETGVAHYAACDALQLPNAEVIAIGREATAHVHGTLLATFVRLAKGAGVTPWTVLARLHELWGRIWVGGGVAVAKLGPKEARIEIVAWPCAGSVYCRTAMRGVIPAMTDLFCNRSYANEISALRTPTSLGFVLSWA